METITKTTDRVLYYHDKEAENKKREAENKKISDIRAGATAAAKALNELYSEYKFKELSEIPVDVKGWTIKRLLETNKDLAELTKVHKLESLTYTIPAWIQKQADSFSKWASVKSGLTQHLQYLKQENETFVIDEEKIAEVEKSFASNETYRKYLNEDQVKRLDQCRRFIALLEESGFAYPSSAFMTHFKHAGNPFFRYVNGKMKPCLDYVLRGETFVNAPINRTDGESYYRNILL